MSSQPLDWLGQLLATDALLLPAPWLMRAWMCLGWGIVTAWLGVAVAKRSTPHKPVHRGVALALGAWAWLPGPFSSAYWLGLAFQMPSATAVLLCALLLRKPVSISGGHAPVGGAATVQVGLGLLVGWALALDTFALLPIQLYAWGFSAAAVGFAMLVSLLPWVLRQGKSSADARLWIVPAAVGVFVALHLPSGNLWDALLDPLLWLALHIHLVQSKRRSLP
jgi:hypothetical protein